MLLQDRVVLLTGGNIGIGRLLAHLCAKEGANLVLAARTRETLEKVAAEVRGLGRDAIAVPTDVTDEAQVKRMVEKALERFGKIDVLVNNAGTAGPAKEAIELHRQEWDDTIALNVTAHWLCSKEVLARSMIPRRTGVILNMASLVAKKGVPLRSADAASRWGAIGFTQSLAWEVGKYNIRVNCICPGAVAGHRIDFEQQARARKTGISVEEIRRKLYEETPLGRMVTQEEVAQTMLFLISDLSSGITGLAVTVAGGQIMY